MLWFPQMVQFPAAKRVVQRTVINEAADGRRVKLADAAGVVREWRLELAGLSAGEWATVAALFEAVEGRLKPFTFLDPFDNLLRWSEELSAAAWEKDAGLALTGGYADPLGGAAAMQAEGGAVWQSLAAPSGLGYCLSFWARNGAVRAFVRTASALSERTFAAGESWSRFEHATQLPEGEETVSFGVAAEGGTVELFGLQAEAQAGASAYKKTGGRGGVYGNAHFGDDALALRSGALGEHSCAVRIVA